MESSTKIQLSPCESYIERFADMHNISIEEACEKAIVKAVIRQYNSPDI